MGFRKNWSWERQNWENIVDFNIWRVLKILEREPCCIREIIGAGVSPHTLYYFVLPRLRKLGAIREESVTVVRERTGLQHKHIERVPTMKSRRFELSLTAQGYKLLKAFDMIGEVVKVARGKVKQKGGDTDG